MEKSIFERLNVRRVLNEITTSVEECLAPFIFRFNNEETRQMMVESVESYLNHMQSNNLIEDHAVNLGCGYGDFVDLNITLSLLNADTHYTISNLIKTDPISRMNRNGANIL